MFKVLALVTVFALVICDEDTTEVNKTIDQIIENRKDDLKQMKTPGFQYDFDVPLTSSPAIVLLKDGPISGLDTLKRVDTKLRKTGDNMEEYTITLGAENIHVNTTGSLSFKRLKYEVDYFAKAEVVELTGVLLKNPESKKRVLRSLKITKFDKFSVKIDAPGVLADAFWNTALRASRFAYEPVLKYAIEKGLKYVIDKEIEDRNKIAG